MKKNIKIFFVLVIFTWVFPARGVFAADPLPSWHPGAAKDAILTFVNEAVKRVPVEERIAVFDNDGTLWTEHPLYFQFVFLLDRVKAEAPKHPEWKSLPAFKAIEANDLNALAALGHKPILELVAAANTGMTTDEYDKLVRHWIDTAKHPRFHRLYKDLTYQPMKEVLAYFRANGFKTFIVSGGGVDFMRPWTQQAYGIPPEQVVGSSVEVKYEVRDGKPVLVREPKIFFIDDKAGKPVGIYQFIGRRPIAAFGNSDGDLEMLEWTAAGRGPTLVMLVHHDDAEREYAYDRKTLVGTLSKALDQAVLEGWTVISMKKDWNLIFSFEKKRTELDKPQ